MGGTRFLEEISTFHYGGVKSIARPSFEGIIVKNPTLVLEGSCWDGTV